MIRRTPSAKAPLLLLLLLAVLSWPATSHAQTIKTISTVAGGGVGGDGGPATAAQLLSPAGIALDSSGNLFISEWAGHRVRRVDAITGIITTVAGTGVPGFNGDGIQATAAQLFVPRGIAVDSAGNLYIADMMNHRVRKVAALTGVITTIAGTDTAGYNGDNITATSAQLNYPVSVAALDTTAVYIADRENDRIRKVSAGLITTYAGTGTAGFSGDGGQATAAQLDNPWAVALNTAGNLYIVDTANQRVRRVNGSTGVITTVAGDGTAGYGGDGGLATAAQLHNPIGVAVVGGTGTIYIADQVNHRVREATRSIWTVAGNGTGGFSGDGGAAIAAELFYPKDVAVDSAGSLYIADTENNRVRKVIPVRSAPGDFDGDLKSDILWRHATHGDIWEWPMNGTTKLSESFVGSVPDTAWVPQGMADLDGDGKADVLWRNTSTGMIYWWRMDGTTKLSETYVGTVDTAYVIYGTGDYNGDGKDDILWRNPAAGDVWIWLMNGATRISEQYVDTVDQHFAIKASGDLNGDTRADIIWQHATTGEVWVWLMDGTTRLSQDYVATVSDLNYKLRGAADHSGDGRAEIEWWNIATGEVWLWTMDGASLTAQTWVASVPDTNYRIAGNGDYDGDGMADLVWHNMSTGEVWMWLMDGTTKLSETYISTVPDTNYRIVR